jgi:hypothetical protein
MTTVTERSAEGIQNRRVRREPSALAAYSAATGWHAAVIRTDHPAVEMAPP